MSEILGWLPASPHWLRELLQILLVSVIAIQYVSEHARVAAIKTSYQCDIVATNGNRKNRKSALGFLVLFGPGFLISYHSSHYCGRLRTMPCNIVLSSYSKIVFSIRSTSAFRSLQKLIVMELFHGPFRF